MKVRVLRSLGVPSVVAMALALLPAAPIHASSFHKLGSPQHERAQMLVSAAGARIDMMGGNDLWSPGADDLWTWEPGRGWRFRSLATSTGAWRAVTAVDRERGVFICHEPASPPGAGMLWAVHPNESEPWRALGNTPFEGATIMTIDAEDRLWAMDRSSVIGPFPIWWRALSDTGAWRRAGIVDLPSSVMIGGWYFDAATQKHGFLELRADSAPVLREFPMDGSGNPVPRRIDAAGALGARAAVLVDIERRRVLLWPIGSLRSGIGAPSPSVSVVPFGEPLAATQFAIDLAGDASGLGFSNVGADSSGVWSVSGDARASIRRAALDSLAAVALIDRVAEAPPAPLFSAVPPEPLVMETSTEGWLLGEDRGWATRDWSTLWRLDLREGATLWRRESIPGPMPDSTELSAWVHVAEERLLYAVGPRSIWAFRSEPTPAWTRLDDEGPYGSFAISPSNVSFDPVHRRLLVASSFIMSWDPETRRWQEVVGTCDDDPMSAGGAAFVFDPVHERLLRSDSRGIYSRPVAETACWRLELRTAGVALGAGEPAGLAAGEALYPDDLPVVAHRRLFVEPRRGELLLDGGISTWYLTPTPFSEAVPLASPMPGARSVTGLRFPSRTGHAVAVDPAADRVVLALGPTIWTWPIGGDSAAWAMATTPVQSADAVELAWEVVEAPAGEFIVWRRTATTAWAVLSSLPATDGALRFTDRTAVAGERHGYRLTRSASVLDLAAHDMWVTREVRAELALHRTWPNPSSGSLMLSLALARTGRAQLELFDLTGRRVWATEYDGGPGQQTAAFELPGSVRTGVYLLRLSADGERRSARIALIR